MNPNLSINLKNSVHLFLAHKGGVGKTTLAALLSEWLIQQGAVPVVFDADAKNQSSCISKYESLRANRLADELLVIDESGLESISQMGFAKLLDSILLEEGPHVIDTGANTYTQWTSFMSEVDVPGLMAEAARTPYLHVVISGGEMCEETVIGAQELARRLPDMKMVLWINQHAGPANIAKGLHFLDSTIYQELLPHLAGTVIMPVLTDMKRKVHIKISPMHLLVNEVKADYENVDTVNAVIYKAWGKSAFDGLDAVFATAPAAAQPSVVA